MADNDLTAVVIDDHDVVRAGLSGWCRDSDPPIEVVAAGPDIDVAFGWRGKDADVVILDLHLRQPDPGLSGLRRLIDAGRQVVVYTHLVDPGVARQCIEIGAKAYVTKGEVDGHLMAAVHDAAAGRAYTTPALGAAILSDRHRRPALSAGERTALTAWCGAKSLKLVAASMNVKESTVKTYIARARLKYEAVGRSAPSKTALIKRALEDGLISPDDLEGEEWDL